MELINKGDVIDLLFMESDITIESIQENRIYLAYAPIDVPSAHIKLDKNRVYLELSELITFISKNIFGTPIQPLFDSNSNWTHIAL